MLDLFRLSFPIVLTTRITKIAKRISPDKLNEGIAIAGLFYYCGDIEARLAVLGPVIIKPRVRSQRGAPDNPFPFLGLRVRTLHHALSYDIKELNGIFPV